jgi:hypothetical protein
VARGGRRYNRPLPARGRMHRACHACEDDLAVAARRPSNVGREAEPVEHLTLAPMNVVAATYRRQWSPFWRDRLPPLMVTRTPIRLSCWCAKPPTEDSTEYGVCSAWG